MLKTLLNWLASKALNRRNCEKLYLKLVVADEWDSLVLDEDTTSLAVYRELWRWRTVNRLKNITGLSRRAIRDSLAKLERFGLVEKKTVGGKTFWRWS